MTCSGGKTPSETGLQHNGTSVNVGQPEYKEKQSMDRAPWDYWCCVTTPFIYAPPPWALTVVVVHFGVINGEKVKFNLSGAPEFF